MNIKWFLPSLFVCSFLVISACAIPQQLDTIEREQRRLRTENVGVRDEASEIRAEFDRVRKTLADTRANFQELQREIRELREKVEEVRYLTDRRLGQVNREGDQRIKGLEERLVRLDDELRTQGKLFKAQEEELRSLREGMGRPGEKKEAMGNAGELAKAKGTGDADAVKKEYEEGLRLLERKDYKVALARFKEFVKRNPDSEFADNAQYWVGECYYALKEYDQSILEFDAVRRKYPNGDKVAAALLKQGFAFLELGDKVDARLILQELIERYPLTAEAAKAKERLKALRS
jgi:tol-pal system protein YbgF